MKVRKLLPALVLLASGLWGGTTSAVTISPVLVELSPARRVVSITITNSGDAAVAFQTSVRRWTQADNGDRYEDSDELIVVPPIADIPAGSSQIFRVTPRRPPGAEERAYRLVFEDVSDAKERDAGTEVAISFRVNHDLPAFVEASGRPRAQPRLGLCANPPPAGRACVRVDNDGNRYVLVRKLTVEDGGEHREVNVSSRVLAGAWREWTFELPSNVKLPLKIGAETSDGTLRLEWSPPAR